VPRASDRQRPRRFFSAARGGIRALLAGEPGAFRARLRTRDRRGTGSLPAVGPVARVKRAWKAARRALSAQWRRDRGGVVGRPFAPRLPAGSTRPRASGAIKRSAARTRWLHRQHNRRPPRHLGQRSPQSGVGVRFSSCARCRGVGRCNPQPAINFPECIGSSSRFRADGYVAFTPTFPHDRSSDGSDPNLLTTRSGRSAYTYSLESVARPLARPRAGSVGNAADLLIHRLAVLQTSPRPDPFRHGGARRNSVSGLGSPPSLAWRLCRASDVPSSGCVTIDRARECVSSPGSGVPDWANWAVRRLFNV